MMDGAGHAAGADPADELGLALAFDRRVQVGGGRDVERIPEGIVVRHPDLPSVHVLNVVMLDAPVAGHVDAAAVAALADRCLAGLNHRFVRLDDSRAGERLAPELMQAGWERGRTVYMVFRGDPAALPADPRAREISEAELEALQLENFSYYDYGPDTSPELPPTLVAAQSAVRAAARFRGFGAGGDGGLQSMCTLYLDPDVHGKRMAMVEEVGTLPAYRERGLAKAVVSAAVRAAGEWGAEMITVPADADDWPQLLYAGLGFEPVGNEVNFTLRIPARRSACRRQAKVRDSGLHVEGRGDPGREGFDPRHHR